MNLSFLPKRAAKVSTFFLKQNFFDFFLKKKKNIRLNALDNIKAHTPGQTSEPDPPRKDFAHPV